MQDVSLRIGNWNNTSLSTESELPHCHSSHIWTTEEINDNLKTYSKCHALPINCPKDGTSPIFPPIQCESGLWTRVMGVVAWSLRSVISAATVSDSLKCLEIVAHFIP